MSMVSRYQADKRRLAHLRPVAGPHRHTERMEVPRVEYEKLSDDRLGETSAAIRARVKAACERQPQRLKGLMDIYSRYSAFKAELRKAVEG